MDYKSANREVYDTSAQEFERKTKSYIQAHILEDATLFAESLPGTKVLDLGSGPGRDSAFFKEKGLKPICFDISSEMIKLCEQKGLEAMIGDLENMPFSEESFDGVWAYTSLLHMPREKLSPVLFKVKQILRNNGLFYMGMKEGNFEGWIESDKYPGSKRFFVLYSDWELRKLIEPYFDIIHTSKISLGKAIFLNYLCKKNIL